MSGLSPVSGETGLVVGELWFCTATPSVGIVGLLVSEGDVDDDRERDMYGRGGGFAGS